MIRCWNCGNDIETDESSVRRSERDRIIKRLEGDAAILTTVGDTYSAAALQQFADSLRSA